MFNFKGRGAGSVAIGLFRGRTESGEGKAIIGAWMAPNEKVEAWGRLSEAAVKALGLKPGDFKRG
jgi:hypothetical protein